MSEEIKELLLGKFTPLKSMKRDSLREECQMWRNIWGWVPSAIKYYISRTGSLIGVSVRNYKRYVGPLLDTQWELKGIEVGVFDKVHDQTDGEWYMERKIVRLPIGQIVAFDWISDRMTEDAFIAKAEQESALENIELEPEETEKI